MERVPTTAEGLKVLTDELKQLKSVERPAIIKAIAAAREHGDLSENAEYTSARERQGFIEGPHRRDRGHHLARRGDRLQQALGQDREVRRHRAAGRRGHRREGEVPDRRALRGRPRQGPHLGHLADRPGADRQDGGRHASRSRRRAARAPTRSWASSSSRRRGRVDRARACPDAARIVAYWIRNSTDFARRCPRSTSSPTRSRDRA